VMPNTTRPHQRGGVVDAAHAAALTLIVVVPLVWGLERMPPRGEYYGSDFRRSN
jgi:hypothetical protein